MDNAENARGDFDSRRCATAGAKSTISFDVRPVDRD
jgi:hypothetical protein